MVVLFSNRAATLFAIPLPVSMIGLAVVTTGGFGAGGFLVAMNAGFGITTSPLFFSNSAFRSATDNSAGSFILFGLFSNTAALLAMPGQRLAGDDDADDVVSVGFIFVDASSSLMVSGFLSASFFACE